MESGLKKMENKLNFNILLCREADDDLTFIKDIFDTIQMGEENKISFDIVTLINGTTNESKINLICAIEQLDNASHNPNERQATIVNQFTLEKSGQNIKNDNGTGKLGSEEMRMEFNSVQHVSGMYFPGKGSYEFQIYRYGDNEINQNKDSINFSDLNKDHLECAYSFEIL